MRPLPQHVAWRKISWGLVLIHGQESGPVSDHPPSWVLLRSLKVTIAGLRPFLEERADITYLDAPHAASGPAYPDVIEYFQPPFFEWWNANQVCEAIQVWEAMDGSSPVQ